MDCVAAIDIGTNTVRLLIQDTDGPALVREVSITRLGQGVDVHHTLAPDAMERTLSALRQYATLIQRHRPARLRIIATSAARDASNRDTFFTAVAQLLGQAPELLDGDSEARLSFAGATLGHPSSTATQVVVDIGGGSTELAAGKGTVERAISLDVGAVRISERHFHHDPPTAQEVDAALADTKRNLARAEPFRSFATTAEWIGVAGTVTTIAAYVAGLRSYDAAITHRMRLLRADVAQTFEQFQTLPVVARRTLLIEPKRAETIIGSCAVLWSIFGHFNLHEMIVSETDILDGVAQSLL